jgi:hypothetical protein
MSNKQKKCEHLFIKTKSDNKCLKCNIDINKYKNHYIRYMHLSKTSLLLDDNLKHIHSFNENGVCKGHVECTYDEQIYSVLCNVKYSDISNTVEYPSINQIYYLSTKKQSFRKSL